MAVLTVRAVPTVRAVRALRAGSACAARRLARARSDRVAATGGRGPDAGSATVWLLSLALLGTGTFAATISVGAVLGARHRAESAADLAALAAADRLLLDPDGGCGRAAGIAAAQGAALVSCAVDRPADAVEVVAEVAAGGLPVRLPVGPARARARAGPVRAPVTAAEDGLGATADAPGPPGPPGPSGTAGMGS
ncbi:Rv3654c family TadE-like protein [Kitasatospora sp. NPDC097643]|uniref:Rv3654c family TadE-like protein n=1 Tax=Kitasatospora sp. NPDC097643 TaxID=3157230 RepID=UPI00331881D7